MAEIEQAEVTEVAPPHGASPLFGTTLPPGAPTPNGTVMKAVNQRTVTERQRLVASGLLKPATIINFNPIDLRVESALIPYSVPRYDKGKSVTLTVGGRQRKASFITVRDAIIRPKIRNVTKPADMDDPIAEYEVMSILPIEIVYQFHNEYFGSDNPVGGMLAFEGDIHVLGDRGKEPKEFRVPKFLTLQDHSRAYFSEPADFKDKLEEALTVQRQHCNRLLDRAYAMFQDQDQRKNINNVDHWWAEFAMQMGWIQKAPEWMYATIKESEVCNGCGAVKKHPKAHFCVCGLYYEPFTSFMAGKPVPPAQLVGLPKEQFDKVKKESKRRRELEAEITGESVKEKD
jgi:hypothetical protein